MKLKKGFQTSEMQNEVNPASKELFWIDYARQISKKRLIVTFNPNSFD